MTFTRQRAQRGFTLVELTVAATVTAVCLVGVYGILSRNLQLEARSMVRHQDRTSAEAVADSIAGAVEHAVMVKDQGIKGGSEPDTKLMFMTCWVNSADAVSLPGTSSPMHRRLYRWGFPKGDPQEGTVEMKMILYAGDRSLLRTNPQGEPADDAAMWNSVQPAVIAKGVKQVQVNYRDMSDPTSKWTSAPVSPMAQTAVRVRVTVGKETIERIVYPSTNAPAAE